MRRAFDVTIRPPGSKSLTNRALLMAALAEGESLLRGALSEADDAMVMCRALESLGAEIELGHNGVVRIVGVAGTWRPRTANAVLNLNNAGTATRFLTAAALLGPEGASITIDGNARMRERPIGELVSAINAFTQQPCAEFVGRSGFPPVRITSPRRSDIHQGPHVFGRTSSSQFISAMMLIAPFLPQGLQIEFATDDVTSRSYIDMTAGLMRRLGLHAHTPDPRRIVIDPASDGLPPFQLDIEPDASGATYFEAAAAMTPNSRVVIEGLDVGPRGSLQGDAQFIRVLSAAGAGIERTGKGLRVSGISILRGIDENLRDMPDTAMTAAVMAAAAPEGTTSTLHGLRTLRVKETDRLSALVTELGKVGATMKIVSAGGDESLHITSGLRHSDCVEFETYDDHRMAMSLSLFGLTRPGVFIRDPVCVRKTYPGFFADLALLYQ